MANSALIAPNRSLVPSARTFEPGSTVLVLGQADARTLGTGFAFWAVMLFGAGYFVGSRRDKTLKLRRGR